jgi:hypothetical protein
MQTPFIPIVVFGHAMNNIRMYLKRMKMCIVCRSIGLILCINIRRESTLNPTNTYEQAKLTTISNLHNR